MELNMSDSFVNCLHGWNIVPLHLESFQFLSGVFTTMFFCYFINTVYEETKCLENSYCHIRKTPLTFIFICPVWHFQQNDFIKILMLT